jgi:hypothetical protein
MRIAGRDWKSGLIRTGRNIIHVIPGRSSERTRNLEIPGSSLREAPE